MTSVVLQARIARRMPDPNLDGVQRHIILCAAQDVPEGIPSESSNVRAQNTDKRIYKTIAKHLCNEEGTPDTFHLKNKGITILADNVKSLTGDRYRLEFKSELHGIVDGGHTYKIVLENRQTLKDAADEGEISQFVKFEILTGVDLSLATEIAGGLNTAVQVQAMSLANHKNAFEWIKEELAGETYISEIAFKQNEPADLDVGDILRILELFNIAKYPNSSSSHPMRAYTGKENVLADYVRDPKTYQRMRPILRDILVLHDLISSEAHTLYNKGGHKRQGVRLAFVENKENKDFFFPFLNKTGPARLYRGALFPMLAAFRWMVQEDLKTGNIVWRGSFEEVKEVWRGVAEQLVEDTRETSDELGRKPDAIAKSPSHWKKLWQDVAMFHQVTLPARTSAPTRK